MGRGRLWFERPMKAAVKVTDVAGGKSLRTTLLLQPVQWHNDEWPVCFSRSLIIDLHYPFSLSLSPIFHATRIVIYPPPIGPFRFRCTRSAIFSPFRHRSAASPCSSASPQLDWNRSEKPDILDNSVASRFPPRSFN